MKDFDYYKKQPKSDTHNHLNLSMRYSAYKNWAGFEIPNFPRKMSGLDEMHEVIGKFTRPACQTAQDVMDLIEMSIQEAINDNVVHIEGSIDIGFIRQFDENLDKFLLFIDNLVKKHEKKIKIMPELGIAKTLEKPFIKKWAEPMMKSKIFKNIDLYGPEISEGIEDCVFLFKMAEKYGLKKKAHVGEFSDAASVKKFVEIFDLNEVQHGIGAAKDDKVLQFLADKKIRCNICPQSNIMLSAVKSLKTHPLRKMLDAGVPISIGTDDILFFEKTNSEQFYDLVKEQVITEAEADRLMAIR
ncbi:adenosine deaminase [Treponema pedis]|uniref:Adenosine deaminase n=1 Tax=Treponema pedis TaxID=409322 RepID=A0A7S6WPB7_9SPIR|nr:adenosine deaminase [Treponema pedis]QOW60848.1 adenosine deaminase [Treponema pedis]